MRILILLSNGIKHDHRVGKEIESLLSAGHQIVLLDFPAVSEVVSRDDGAYKIHSVRLWTRQLPRNLLFWPLKYLEMNLRFFLMGKKIKPDIVHCVDRLPLIAAYLIAKNLHVKYIYDSKEIHAGLETDANKPKWFWLWMERFLSQRAARVLVTDHFRLDITARILQLEKSRLFVLMNLPKIPPPSLSERNLRADSPWPDGKIAVYAGAISPNRHLEDIITALTFLPENYNIAIIGVGDEGYKNLLRSLARNLGIQKRLAILPPVGWAELPYYIGTADCALAFYQKNSLNNLYCSPSKLFDALMAGLPVISGDNPLVLEVLQQNDAGICLNSITGETIAQSLQELLSRDDLKDMKKRLANIAKTQYSWETQEESFLGLYKEVLCQ